MNRELKRETTRSAAAMLRAKQRHVDSLSGGEAQRFVSAVATSGRMRRSTGRAERPLVFLRVSVSRAPRRASVHGAPGGPTGQQRGHVPSRRAGSPSSATHLVDRTSLVRKSMMGPGISSTTARCSERLTSARSRMTGTTSGKHDESDVAGLPSTIIPSAHST